MEDEVKIPVPGRKYKVTRIYINSKGHLESRWREMICIQAVETGRITNTPIYYFGLHNINKALHMSFFDHGPDYTSASKTLAVTSKDYPVWTKPAILTLDTKRDYKKKTTPNEMIIFEEIPEDKVLNTQGEPEEQVDITLQTQEEKWKNKYRK